MTFLTGLAQRSVENPGRPLTDATLLDTLGDFGTESGTSAPPERSLRLGTVFRGVQIIASAGGGLPLKAYRHENRDEVRSSVLTNDDGMTPMERWETSIAYMALWGAAPLWKERDSRGTVRSLTPVHPARLGVQLRRTGDVARPYERRFTIDGRGDYGDYELLYIPFLSLDGYTGIGPIGYCRETFGNAVSNERLAGKMFRSGFLVDGILTTDQDLNETKATRLKRRIKALLQGVEHAHEVAVMDNGAQWTPIGMPAKDAQFLEQRKFSRTEIAGLLGLPGWMLNDQEKSTSWGTGMEQQFRTFVTLTLKAYLQKIEQRINLEILPSTQYAEFKVEGLLRGDSQARAAFYTAGITCGWLVPNDVRRLENLHDVPWGDEPFLPNNTPAGTDFTGDDSTDEEG